MLTHNYHAKLHWDGSTAAGARAYSRDHTAVATPAATQLDLSADPAFRGNPDLLNPEQLVVMAASSCQLLSFLYLAARAGIDVLAYDDEATSHLHVAAERTRLAAIQLHVTVTVAAGTDEATLHELAAEAHERCFIANSLSVPVEVSTTVVTA